MAVIPGIFSGSQTTKPVINALRKAGCEPTDNFAQADIVVAHSAGCLWAHQISDRQRLILIDPLYWPGRTISQRIRSRLKSNAAFRSYDIPYRAWLSKQLWGMYYAFFDIRRTAYILRQSPKFSLDALLAHRSVILVRNQYDDWLTPDLGSLLDRHKDTRLVELPGEHDDLVYNPTPYIDLVQSIAGIKG